MNNGINPNDEKAMRIAYLIAGFIRQTLSPEEHDELDRWVEESDENMLLFEELIDAENIEIGLQQLKAKNPDGAYKKLRSRIPFEKKKQRRTWSYSIAASVLLVITAAYFLINRNPTTKTKEEAVISKADIAPGSNKAVLILADGRQIVLGNQSTGDIVNENGYKVMQADSGQIAYSSSAESKTTGFNSLTTPRGGQYQVTLSDGTRVWLNAETTLRYPATFNGAERKVELEGEAYFEVAHDSKHPFHLISKKQDITVLGTEFNVKAYGDELITTTSLVRGKIELTAANQKLVVKPGEEYFTESTGIRKNSSPDIEGRIAWKEGMFHFRDERIEEVLKQVSRWYDADIIYEGKSNYHFNADISRKLPVSKILKLLEKTGGVHFEIEGKTIKVKP